MFVDGLADGRLICLQLWRSRGNSHCFSGRTGLKRHIDLQFLADRHGQILLSCGGEPRRSDGNAVMPDLDRRKGVVAAAGGMGFQTQALIRVQQCHLSVGYRRPGGVLNRSRNRALIDLSRGASDAGEHDNRR